MNISRRVAGRRLLEKLLPRAEKWLDEQEATRPEQFPFFDNSPLVKAAAPYLTLKNAEAIFISEGQLGGWIADIAFKSVPLGVVDMIGTPVSSPHKTRAEAEQAAIIILAALIAKERNGTGDEAAPPVMLYHGHEVALNQKLLERLQGTSPRIGGDEAVRMLCELEERLFVDGFDEQLIETLPREENQVLGIALHLAALAGVLRYPENQPATPSHHTASVSTLQ